MNEDCPNRFTLAGKHFHQQSVFARDRRPSALQVQCQHPIHVHFRQRIVGEFYADLFIEGKVIVELKAAKAIAPEDQALIINYIKATGIEVGLLIHFGNPKRETKRFTRHK